MTLHVSDEALVVGFEEATLPVAAFSHREHVRTAWIFVRRHGMPHALSRFSEALKRFAEAKGAPGLYHETITWAYLFIIAERLRMTPADCWSTFSGAHPDLLAWKPSVLDRFYTAQTLWSEDARRRFVMPDRLLP